MKLYLLILLSLALCQQSENSQDEEKDIDDQEIFMQRHGVTKFNQREDQEEGVTEMASEISTKIGFMATMLNYFQVQKEVDQLIGLQDQEKDNEGHILHPADLSNLKAVLNNNKKWAKQKTKYDKQYFTRHTNTQKPKYLWIGCSDSRLPANEILGLDYGQVFVLRNVANMVSPSDISSNAVIQYAVEVLQVKDILVTGHYGCGGIKAAVTKYNHGPLQAWLSKLRRMRHKHAHAFSHLKTIDEKAKLLVEINVKEQVFNVASTISVQQAWKQGRELRIHGLVFNLQTGRLIDLNLTMHSSEQLPDQLAIFQK